MPVLWELEPAILKRCVQATGLSRAKCVEVAETIFETIAQQLKDGQPVTLDGFGDFGPIRTKHRWHNVWRPSVGVLARIAESTGDPDRPLTWKGDEAIKKGRAVAQPDMAPEVNPEHVPDPEYLLPVKKLRPDDAVLIERWLRARAISTPGAIATHLYSVDTTKQWAENTVVLARAAIERFARRSPAPLLSVGLGDDHSVQGPISILAFARDYYERSKPRLARFAVWRESNTEQRIDLALRTQGWARFYLYSRDFYSWLETQGMRATGTNPMATMNRRYSRYITNFSAGTFIFTRAWCVQMLEYPRLKIREKAMLYLLANGLRASEVCQAKLENLSLSRGELTIVGKGRKQRTVLLFPWTIAALSAYLETRRLSASPYVFPSPLGTALGYDRVLRMVIQVRDRVFPGADQAHMRAAIMPHRFRHYFVSELKRRGVRTKIIMHQTGHASAQTLEVYDHADDAEVSQTLARVSARPWFATSGGSR